MEWTIIFEDEDRPDRCSSLCYDLLRRPLFGRWEDVETLIVMTDSCTHRHTKEVVEEDGNGGIGEDGGGSNDGSDDTPMMYRESLVQHNLPSTRPQHEPHPGKKKEMRGER